MNSTENKKYWDKWGADYSSVWSMAARKKMSQFEEGFIHTYYMQNNEPKTLDVGVGNGRILSCLLTGSGKDSEIYGVDISGEMVEFCRHKFKENELIREIRVCDLSQEDLPYQSKYQFITVIRVLKYNHNWKEVIGKLSHALVVGGLIIFTMPNKNSISRFSGDTFTDKNIPLLYSSVKELKKLMVKVGLECLEIRAFSKLPNFLYHLSNNIAYVSILIGTERFLEMIFGRIFGGRELFIVCKKSR